MTREASDSTQIYEVTLDIDSAIVAEFDEWLPLHVNDMLALPFFNKAKVFTADAEDGKARRVVQYFLASGRSLDDYVAGPAAEMRAEGVQRFGDAMQASRRVLHATSTVDDDLQIAENCLNCGTTLLGQYCANCGQRSTSRLISIWELLRDAFGDLFELDSRIWRTVIPLLMRPGQLTRDYLQGKRARFMPPFRTYLVLSVLFFVVAVFDPRDSLPLLYEDRPVAETEEPEEAKEAEEVRQSVDEVRQELLQELADEGIIDPSVLESVAEPEQVTEPQSDESDTEPATDDSDFGFTVSVDDDQCDFREIDVQSLPKWFHTRLTDRRLDMICEQIMEDRGKTIGNKILDSIPAALIVLLPLMALVLKMLYPLSRRYYVEHLLFVVHYHAFFFLLLIVMVLWSRLVSAFGGPDWMLGLPNTVGGIYTLVYLYKALRRVYGQGHLATIPKFIVLIFAYIAGTALIMTIATLIAAFSLAD